MIQFDTSPQQGRGVTRPGLFRPGVLTRMGTFNTRTLRNPGEAEQLAAELGRAGVSICGLQEVRRRGIGEEQLDSGWRLLWSGDERSGLGGVGALLDPTAARALKGQVPVSDRILLLHLHGTIATTVVVAYAPTNVASNADKEAFYTQLSTALDSIPAHHMVCVLGDMNAQVGKDRNSWPGVIGGFGAPSTNRPPEAWVAAARAAAGARAAGTQAATAGIAAGVITAAASQQRQRRPPAYVANDNGRRCLEMCSVHGLFVANTFFRHRDEHTATFISNTQQHWATVDLILVSRRFRSSVMDCRARPTATTHHSDHRLVVCDLRLKLRRPQPRAQRPPAFNTAGRRRDEPATLAYQAAISQRMVRHTLQQPQPQDSTAEVQALTAAMQEAAGVCFGRRERKQRQPWITEATLQLAEQKRAAFLRWQQLRDSLPQPSPNPAPLQVVQLTAAALQLEEARTAYRRLTRQTQAAARRDHDTALQRQAAEMDRLMAEGKTGAAFQIAARLRGLRGTRSVQSIETPQGVVHGGKVATAFAEHFRAALNVDTQVAAQQLDAIPKQLGAPAAAHSEVARAALAAAGEKQPVQGSAEQRLQQRAGAVTRGTRAAAAASAALATGATQGLTAAQAAQQARARAGNG